MPKLPRGMTANMMQIVKVNTVARKNHTSYGVQIARCDMSDFVSRRKKPKPKVLCAKCGAEVIAVHGRKRKFCDACSAESRSKKDKKPRAKPTLKKSKMLGVWGRNYTSTRIC